MEKSITDALIDRRAWFGVLAMILLVVVASGARHLYFDSDYEIFFKPDNPQLLAYEHIQDEYTKSDNIMFVVHATDGNVFSPNALAAMQTITEAAWVLPYSIRVDSLNNYQYSEGVGDDLIVYPLFENPSELSATEIERRRKLAMSEPVLMRNLLSDAGHVAAINVRLELPDDAQLANRATTDVVDAARAIAADVTAANPQLDVHLLGVAVVNNAFNESSQKDSETLVPIMFGIVVGMLWLFLGSVSATLVSVVVIALSIIATMGFTGWLGYALNSVNVSAPVVILTLSVCDSVHLLAAYLHRLAEGDQKLEAMRYSLRINLQPVFITSLTTAIGFLSLNFSDSPPFRELGNVVAFGVMAAMLFSVTVLPGLMVLLPAPKGRPRAVKLPADALGEFALKHRKAAFIVTLVVTLPLIACIPLNNLNDDTIEYFKPPMPFRLAADFTLDNLTGLDNLTYSLGSGESNGITDPKYLEKVEAFVQWLKSQPEVTYVSTFTDVIKRLNRNMHGDDPDWYRLPESRELAAQYVLLYELSLPYGLDLNDMINFDKSSLRINARLKGLKAQQLIDFEARAQQWLLATMPEMATPGSSVSLMFAHIGQNNIRSMMGGSVIALLLISLTMMLALRSFRYGLLSLIPNAFPAATAFGLWGIFVGEVNLAVAVVFSMTIGIVVDDSVHFLSKYLRALRGLGLDAADSIRYAFDTVAPALIVTTLALTAGFLVLAQSSFAVNSSMGTMVAMTIALALVLDLMFLPAILMWVDRRQSKTQ